MWKYPVIYDVIVMGAGHAGCEAAYAAAKMGCKTLLLTMNLDTIAKMSCNPSIGGVGKGHMVREIDALGGLMGKVIEPTSIWFRMLNASKGPAVWAPRAQADKMAYQIEMKHQLEKVDNLDIKQGTVTEILVKNDQIQGVETKEGICFLSKALVISSGTFMRGLIHIGENNMDGGRAGDKPSVGLSASLENFGFKLGRLKTGTPARVNSRSIDYSLTEEQPSERPKDNHPLFSYDPLTKPILPQVSCHIAYTTKETKEIIEKNIHKSPMYSGKIQCVGPRYCPSIEDKVVRFSDKERHQIFLEPEGLNTEEVYLNGLSSSLPIDVQYEFLRSIPALKNAQIMRPAYAIEYDYVLSGQVDFSLETKKVEGLFFAGQINGTTGYEEAAAQGLLAGINAALKVQKKPSFVLQRSESYIGVMIDDLVTKGVDEPYRMFTSRAEHRLLLRQDNADLRLRHYGFDLGLVSNEQYQRTKKKKDTLEQESKRLSSIYKQVNGKGLTLSQLLCRPENTYQTLLELYPDDVVDFGDEINLQIELNIKYAGYIQRQEQEVARLSQIEKTKIPSGFNFSSVQGLRNEAKQRFLHVMPSNLGQASRIPGISPADISILMIALKKHVSSP